jgi:hypothetical protein
MISEYLTPEERTERLLTLGWWNSMFFAFEHWKANEGTEADRTLYKIVEYLHNI